MQFISKTVSKKFINKEILSVGFDESYIENALKKHLFLSIKIFNLSPPQATILKQTALSCDCDCAVSRGVIDCSVEYSNCILSATASQIKKVADKLLNQPFSLKNLSQNLYQELNLNLKEQNKTKIMGILNLTPDSFSDGGEFIEIDKAINHALDMIEQGADCIDIGAQSTRPQADMVSSEYEIEKVVPVVIALKKAYPNIELSVDTMSFDCAIEALEAGCDIINDVSFLSNIEFAKICAKYDKKLVIMHSRGNSKTMDNLVYYDNLVDVIYKELYEKINIALGAGLKKESIIIDLGFGFAKTIEQNFELLSRIAEFKSLNCPILAGVSRKRFLQDVINTKEPKDTDLLTALASSYLIQEGIEYIRVHEVSASIQALKFSQRLSTLL